MKKVWAIIENAGYEREQDIGGRFKNFSEAYDYLCKHYDTDELESLHVEIARVLDDGSFSYDY